MFVLTDCGLESATPFRQLVTAGGHPLRRVKGGGLFRPTGWRRFRPMGAFAATDGDQFAARGTAYRWADEPLTCLPPGAADPCGYAFRARIGQKFRPIKRGGWQRTRMSDPARVERVFTRGLAAVMAGLRDGHVKTGRFIPEPWPNATPIPRITEADFDAREETYP